MLIEKNLLFAIILIVSFGTVFFTTKNLENFAGSVDNLNRWNYF